MDGVLGDEAAAGRTASQLLDARRARDAVFDGYGDGFGEPAWDTLLLLFCAHAEGQGLVPIADVVAETNSPEQIAKAYIRWLETQDLVAVNGTDVVLTVRATGLMMKYLKGDDA